VIIVKINGGLGNQLFQYAAGRYLSVKHKTKLLLDVSEFDVYKLRKFELEKYMLTYNVATKEDIVKTIKIDPPSYLLKILKKPKLNKFIPNYYREPFFHFDENYLNLENKVYLEGYFQSEKYFQNIRATLARDFKIRSGISSYGRYIRNEIEKVENAVSIHIRRGDYVSNNSTNKVHGVLPRSYFYEAINLIEKKFNNVKYFVFSDDVEWSKKNIRKDNLIFIENQEARIPHEDIYLMSLCKHNIISNSSFSWWGAWLNTEIHGIKVAPIKWFNSKINTKDLIPEDWVRI